MPAGQHLQTSQGTHAVPIETGPRQMLAPSDPKWERPQIQILYWHLSATAGPDRRACKRVKSQARQNPGKEAMACMSCTRGSCWMTDMPIAGYPSEQQDQASAVHAFHSSIQLGRVLNNEAGTLHGQSSAAYKEGQHLPQLSVFFVAWGWLGFGQAVLSAALV